MYKCTCIKQCLQGTFVICLDSNNVDSISTWLSHPFRIQDDHCPKIVCILAHYYSLDTDIWPYITIYIFICHSKLCIYMK